MREPGIPNDTHRVLHPRQELLHENSNSGELLAQCREAIDELLCVVDDSVLRDADAAVSASGLDECGKDARNRRAPIRGAGYHRNDSVHHFDRQFGDVQLVVA